MRRIPQDNLNQYSLDGAPFVHGFKNRIINGNFDLWQRGTSLGAGTGNRYLADMWFTTSTGSTVAPSQQVFTLGQTSVPGEPTFYHRSVVASSAGAANFAQQVSRVESVRTFAGQVATLSFWAKADAPKNIAVEFIQRFGSGGSPSADVAGIGVTTILLTTTFQKFTVTLSLPSISGKTLGTAGDDCLQLNFWFDAGSSFNSRTNSLGQQSGTFDIAQVQLEPGAVATAFEQRPRVQELAMAQRYATLVSSGVGQCISTTTALVTYPLTTSLRASPTLLPLANGVLSIASGSTQAVTSISLNRFQPPCLVFQIDVASGLVAGNATLHVDASVLVDAGL